MVKFRKMIAAISAAALLSTFCVVVPAAHAEWYTDAIAALDLQGSPGKAINRCEAAVIWVKALGVDPEVPDPYPFTDVPTWCKGYAGVLYNMGVVEGYKKADGTLTGKYGANDGLNRAAQAVMTVKALGLTEKATLTAAQEKEFAGLDWAKEAFQKAVAAELIKGKPGGILDPKGNNTLAEAAVVSYRAIQEGLAPGIEEEEEVTPDEEEDVTPDEEEEEEETPVSEGTLTVELASDTPAGTSIADGTAYNVLAVLDMTANGDEVQITGIDVTKYGISADTAVSGVLVWDDTGARHGNIVTFADSVGNLTFGTDPIKIPADTTKKVKILVNIAATAGDAGAITVGAGVAAASAITSNATEVTGTFPAVGNHMTVTNGANSVGALTVDVVTLAAAARNVSIGDTAVVTTKFSFAAGANEDIRIDKIKLRNNGTGTDGDFTNLTLKDASGVAVATVEESVNKIFEFNFSADPVKVTKGKTVYYTIEVDVKDGPGRTAQFLIDNDYDIVVYGTGTGSGLLAAVNTAGVDAAFPIGDAAGLNALTVQNGTLTISKDPTSPTGNIGRGAKDQVFARWKLEASGDALEVRKIGFDLDSGDTGSLGVPTAGVVGTVKLKKASTGTILYFIAASDVDLYDNVTTGTDDQFTLSSYFTIKAGESEIIEVVGDVASTATAATSLTAEIGNIEYKRIANNTIVTAATAADVTGNLLTCQVASLTLVANTSFASGQAANNGSSGSIVAGGTATQIASFMMQAGAAEDVTISTIILDLTAGGATDITTNQEVTNLRLKIDGVQQGSTVATPAATDNTFSVSIAVPASSSKTVDVFADISTAAATAAATGSLWVNTTAVGDVTGTGAISQSAINSAAATNFQSFTIRTGGTLTVALPSQAPQAVHHAAETGMEVLSFKMEAQYEDVNVNKILVRVSESTSGANNLKNLTLKDSAGTTLKTGISFVSNIATIAGLSIVVPKDSSKTYILYADTNPSGTMYAATNVSVNLGGVDATGANSGSAIVEQSGTSEIGTTSSAGHYAVGDLIVDSAVLIADGVGGAGSQLGIVTTAADEGVDLVATGLTAQFGQAAAAADLFAVTDFVAKVPYVAKYLIGATGANAALAIGDLIYYYDADAAASSGICVVTTAIAANALVSTAAAPLTAACDSQDTAQEAKNVGAGDYVLKLAAATSSTADMLGGNTTLDAAIPLGYPVFLVDNIAGSTGLYMAGAAGALNDDLTTDNEFIAGADIDNGDLIYSYLPYSTEAVTATSSYTYNVGDLVMVHDSSASVTVPAQFYVVNTAVRAGSTLAADILANSTSTSTAVLTAAAGANSADQITSFFGPQMSGNTFVLHDSEPVIAASSTSFSTSIIGGTQVVAIFDITAQGPRAMSVKSLTIDCTGSGESNTELNNNTFEVWVDGALKKSQSAAADLCGITNAGNGTQITFDSPIEISAGTTETFTVKYDTTADANQWATGESLVFKIDGKSGQDGAVGNTGIEWFYTSASPGNGTEPTNGTPATVSDSYPVSSPTLTY